MRNLLTVPIMLAAAAWPATGFAADDATPAAGGLEEIVVTSQKRSEDVRLVPASVSVLSGYALQQSHITDIEDVTRAIPSVSFASGGGPGLDNIEIRGISSTSGSATVGIYLDEVPVTVKNLWNGAVEPRFFDVDRVEVLRGPQGTLYGSSSMGGTIRFISRQPKLDEFSVNASADLSGTDHGGVNYDDQLVVNAPLVDDVAALRVGVDVGGDSGYIDQYRQSGELAHSGVNDDRWAVLRASARIVPDDSLTITPAMFAQHEQTADTSVYYPSLGLYKQDKLVPERSRDNLFVPSVTVTKDLDAVTLTSITSYFWRQFNRTEDGTVYNSGYLGYLISLDPPPGPNGQDGSQVGNLPGPELTRTTTAVTSQEFRIASKPPDESGLPISWIAGLYYSEYQTHRSDDAYVTGLDSTFLKVYGIPIQTSNVFAGYTFPGDSVDLSAIRLEERQYAAFADATYFALPGLRLTAGIRYSFARSAFTQYQQGYFAGNGPAVLSTNAKFYAATPKFSVTYDISDDATLYATAAKGFRLGGSEPYVPSSVCGADLSLFGLNSAPSAYGSDKLWSYEAGAKGRFLDNTLSINGDFYYVQWSKIQQTVSLPTCGYTITTNVGDAESYGPEVEINYQPVSGLTLTVAADYAHAELTSVTSSVGAAVGDKILNVPDWMAAFRADYSHPIGAEMVGFVRADYDWTGRSHGSFSPTDPDYSRPVYAVLNASIGLTKGAYEVSLYAKNLLDESKAIQHPSILFLPEAYTLRPLTVGVLAKAQF